MSRGSFVIYIFGLVASISSATTINLDSALTNAGFEEDTVFETIQTVSDGASPAQMWNLNASGWEVSGSAGTYRSEAGTYLGSPAFIDPMEGLNVGFVTPGAYMYQDLSVMLQANTDYVLSYSVGRRYDAVGSDYRIVVTAGSGALVEGQNMWTYSNNSGSIAAGGWTTATLNFNSGESQAVGQTLRVWLANDGGTGINLSEISHEVVFDLSSMAPVPEPATIVLLGAGLIGLGLLRRKRT